MRDTTEKTSHKHVDAQRTFPEHHARVLLVPPHSPPPQKNLKPKKNYKKRSQSYISLSNTEAHNKTKENQIESKDNQTTW